MLTISKITLLIVSSQFCAAPPIWPEYDMVQTNGWSLETMLKKRTFHMFEPIEIATTFRFLGKRSHPDASAFDNELYCMAFRSGEQLPTTGFGYLHSGPSIHSTKSGDINPGYHSSYLIRLDTVLDMSLPGTYEVLIVRKGYSFPLYSKRHNRQLAVDSLSSQGSVIQVLPMPAFSATPHGLDRNSNFQNRQPKNARRNGK